MTLKASPRTNGANLGFEEKLWKAADKLRSNVDAAEYKHVVLGLIFLKYITDAFNELHKKLTSQISEGADPEEPDEYHAERVFWVPKEARWDYLQKNTYTRLCLNESHDSAPIGHVSLELLS